MTVYKHKLPTSFKKPRLDDIIAAMELQHRLDFPTNTEKERTVETYNHQVRANQLEIQNSKQSPLLLMPPEIVTLICERVFNGQVLRFSTVNGRARLADTRPLAMSRTCRMLRQITAEFPYTMATIQIVTFKFVSLLDTWRTAIASDTYTFREFLTTLPTGIKRFEVVGVESGYDGSCRMGLDMITGMKNIDHEARLRRCIRVAHPKAEVTFRVVKNVRQL